MLYIICISVAKYFEQNIKPNSPFDPEFLCRLSIQPHQQVPRNTYTAVSAMLF